MGAKDIVVNDIDGIINRDDKANYNFLKSEIADITNPENIKGGLKEAVIGRDVFIGVSAANILSVDMVKTMNKDAIVLLWLTLILKLCLKMLLQEEQKL